jgi:hypothetical protein
MSSLIYVWLRLKATCILSVGRAKSVGRFISRLVKKDNAKAVLSIAGILGLSSFLSGGRPSLTLEVFQEWPVCGAIDMARNPC